MWFFHEKSIILFPQPLGEYTYIPTSLSKGVHFYHGCSKGGKESLSPQPSEVPAL